MADRSAAEFFESYSADFNALYGSRKNVVNSIVDRVFRKSMRLRFERSMAGCSPIEGKTVLDVGCGPGHYAVHLARKGAASCFGLDFSPAMIRLSIDNALRQGVSDRCTFEVGDFSQFHFAGQFDYSIVMGFMDYVKEPGEIIDKVLSVTKSKAFFSFPVADGILAWQRKLRYKSRCDLFLYRLEHVKQLCDNRLHWRTEIERISRDFFVTLTSQGKK
jgi:2-polyprenyl-3-methyl-5-hydroxy-6-metoxy-1,4-benzoquinol methylase